jgi:hypothetical protein
MNMYELHTGKVPLVQAMEANRGIKGIAPFILTSALDGGK